MCGVEQRDFEAVWPLIYRIFVNIIERNLSLSDTFLNVKCEAQTLRKISVHAPLNDLKRVVNKENYNSHKTCTVERSTSDNRKF